MKRALMRIPIADATKAAVGKKKRRARPIAEAPTFSVGIVDGRIKPLAEHEEVTSVESVVEKKVEERKKKTVTKKKEEQLAVLPPLETTPIEQVVPERVVTVRAEGRPFLASPGTFWSVRVAWYTGLLYVLIGVSAAIHGLGGIYVDSLYTETMTVVGRSATALVLEHDMERLTTPTTSDLNTELSYTTALAPEASELTHPVTLHIESVQGVVEGIVQSTVSVLDAQRVDLYLIPTSSLTPLFLGTAERTADTLWSIDWSSFDVPNGAYTLRARITNVYGTYDGATKEVVVRNRYDSTPTDVTAALASEQIAGIKEQIAVVDAELQKENPAPSLRTALRPFLDTTQPVVVAEEVGTSTEEMNPLQELSMMYEDTSAIFVEATTSSSSIDIGQAEAFEKLFDTLLVRLAAFVRADNKRGMDRTKEDIDTLVFTTLENPAFANATSTDLEGLRNAVRDTTTALTARVIARETLVRERVGPVVLSDTDRDGLTGYDEVTNYGTDPYIADSDLDGFIDGSEIALGYNPNNAESESTLKFSDPRTFAGARDALVSITIPETAGEVATTSSTLKISGTGLPHSFVTLHIYSDQLVVSARTNSDGVWSVDKDLPLQYGSHTIYATFSDNHGDLIAVSAPQSVTRTAAGYSFAGRTTKASELFSVYVPMVLSANTFLLVSALLVIICGLLLLMISVFISRKQQESESVPVTSLVATLSS